MSPDSHILQGTRLTQATVLPVRCSCCQLTQGGVDPWSTEIRSQLHGLGFCGWHTWPGQGEGQAELRPRQAEGREVDGGCGGICSGWSSERPGLTLQSPDLMMKDISKPSVGTELLPASSQMSLETEENSQLRSSDLVASPFTHCAFSAVPQDTVFCTVETVENEILKSRICSNIQARL